MSVWRQWPERTSGWAVRVYSSKSSKKLQEQIFAALQLLQRNPFLGRVGLRNIPGPKEHTGNPRPRQHPCVAEIIYAGGRLLSDAAKQFLHQRLLGVGFKRTTDSGVERTDLSRQFVLA